MHTGYRSLLRAIFHSTLYRFLVVGVANTAVDFLIFNIVIHVMTVSVERDIVFAKLLGFLGASICSYLLNAHWTFSAGNPSVKNFGIFLLVSFFALLINVSVVYIAYILGKEVILKDRILLANIAFLFATGASLFANYFGYKFIVFKVKQIV